MVLGKSVTYMYLLSFQSEDNVKYNCWKKEETSCWTECKRWSGEYIWYSIGLGWTESSHPPSAAKPGRRRPDCKCSTDCIFSVSSIYNITLKLRFRPICERSPARITVWSRMYLRTIVWEKLKFKTGVSVVPQNNNDHFSKQQFTASCFSIPRFIWKELSPQWYKTK